jgi:hypothetical protein
LSDCNLGTWLPHWPRIPPARGKKARRLEQTSIEAPQQGKRGKTSLVRPWEQPRGRRTAAGCRRGPPNHEIPSPEWWLQALDDADVCQPATSGRDRTHKKRLTREVSCRFGLRGGDCGCAFFLKGWCMHVFTVPRRKPTRFASSLLDRSCSHIAEFPAHDTAVPSCRGAAPIANSVTGPDWEKPSDNATPGIKAAVCGPATSMHL